MDPVQACVPAVIADVIRRQPPSAARTTFAWSVAVGPAVARAATVELNGRVLLVTPKDARWSREILRSSDTILARIQVLLGAAAVDTVRVLDAPRAASLEPRY